MTTATLAAPASRAMEHRFYLWNAIVMVAAIVLGFSRTYYLRSWFPELAHLLPPEPYFFYVHGVCFTAWVVLIAVQPWLVWRGQLRRHRQVGWAGIGVAVAVVISGLAASLIAARRPGGFLGIPVPSTEFLLTPLMDMALFAGFIGFGVAWRRDTHAHKRLMTLATLGLMDAAVARWPFADMGAGLAGTWWTRTDVGVDLFLLPLIAWDLASRGRLHRVTLAGALVLVLSQPLRLVVSRSDVWQRIAAWLIGAQ